VSGTGTTTPAQLAARYGAHGTSRWLVAAVVVVTVAFAAVVGWAGWQVANPPATWSILTWQAVGPDHTVVRLAVHHNADASVTCVLRAQDARGTDVGYATITFPAGRADEQATYPLRTLSPPDSVDIIGCAANGAPQVAPPGFPPGVAAPPQPWTPGG